MKKVYDIKGMSCAMCKNNLEKGFNHLDGYYVSVNLLENKLLVQAENIDDELVVKTVSALGYEVVFEKAKKHKYLTFIISLIALLVLMYFSMGKMFNAYMFDLSHFHQGIIQLLLTIIIYYLQRSYLINGFKALRSFKPNMESLVFLSVSASFIYSLYVVFKIYHHIHHYHLYFETGAMILIIVAIGKYLENINKLEATSATVKLMQLKNLKANLFKDNQIESVAISSLKPNDLIIVKAGENIPIDAVIIQGQGEIDESLISGESLPIFKKENDIIIGGSLNLNGYLIAKVIVEEKDSVLANIIHTCQQISATKLPIEKLVDKIASIFVPLIIIIALIVFGVWFMISKDFELAFNYALSTLTISCPCALGLATPSAIVAAVGVLSKQGILLKDVNVLEKGQELKTLIVDKTGTLSENKMQIVESYFINQEDIAIMAAIEKNSNHPIAKSIETTFKAGTYHFSEIQEIIGKGIKAKLNDDYYFLGNLKLFDDFKIKYPLDIVDKANNEAYNLVLFAKNNLFLGYIYLEDRIKNSSYLAIKEFKKRFIDVIMCTGDNQKIAAKVAKKLAINNFYSEVNPNDKYEIIKKYQQSNLVAMVGDGVNDALALASADISFAIASGSDISYSNSKVLLLKNDLKDIAYFIDVSKMTMKIIKQNLFWALFYNSLLIPMAAGLFSGYGLYLNPMLAALMMSISSVIVLNNALRIKKMSKKDDSMEIKINNMTCGHCEKNIENIFNKYGVKAKAFKDKKIVNFENNDNLDLIIQEIEDFGYKVEK